MALFKIGDRVRVVSQNGGHYGQMGTITGVQRTTDDQHDAPDSYVVEFDNGQLEFFVGADLELK